MLTLFKKEITCYTLFIFLEDAVAFRRQSKNDIATSLESVCLHLKQSANKEVLGDNWRINSVLTE